MSVVILFRFMIKIIDDLFKGLVACPITNTQLIVYRYITSSKLLAIKFKLRELLFFFNREVNPGL